MGEAAAGLTGNNAIRVPTPKVSLAILNLTLKQKTSVDELNLYLRGMSLESPLQDQIDYTNSPEYSYICKTWISACAGMSIKKDNRHVPLYRAFTTEFSQCIPWQAKREGAPVAFRKKR